MVNASQPGNINTRVRADAAIGFLQIRACTPPKIWGLMVRVRSYVSSSGLAHRCVKTRWFGLSKYGNQILIPNFSANEIQRGQNLSFSGKYLSNLSETALT